MSNTAKDSCHLDRSFIYSKNFGTIYLIFVTVILPVIAIYINIDYFKGKSEQDYFCPSVAYVVLILIPYIIISKSAEKHATKNMKIISDWLNLSFYPEGKEDLIYDLSYGYISNEMIGEHNGYSFSIYDNHSNEETEDYPPANQTIIHFKCEKTYFPQFELRPKGVFDKAFLTTEELKSEELDAVVLAEHENFLKSYTLKAGNKSEILKLFDLQIIDLIEEQKKISILANKHEMQIFKENVYLNPQEPEEWNSFKTTGLKIFDAFQGSCQNTGSRDY